MGRVGGTAAGLSLIVIGSLTLPRERLRIFATWLTTCSNAGYMNPSNCISGTGR